MVTVRVWFSITLRVEVRIWFRHSVRVRVMVSNRVVFMVIVRIRV